MTRPSQLPLDLPHRASQARDDLIVTAANRLAVAAVDRWPDWGHPVLVVVGPPGAGKSHLAAAWAEMAGAVPPSPDATGDEPFAVVIDDVDRGRWNEAEIFGIVNAARLGGGSVLLTSRVRPAAMEIALPDLASRLKAATSAELGAPDEALLEGVLAKLFADRQMAVDHKLVAYAAARMERSLDAANRFVAAVDREALARKERINRSLLADVLKAPDFGGNDRKIAKPADHDSEIGNKGSDSAEEGRSTES
ncbi:MULTISPECIES: hypothetical protein [unclassified Aureimonas]|uniref:hypothetical protein n=1 Tax=unclassified Aureimonas TaxID=2615206 RepID=UPI000A4D1B51|nr:MULTISPECIES: hypothetical protein [unclassified Aureimonas]